jgi:superfamily II DNA or RNA helicase
MNESIRLRDYQIECLETILSEFKSGVTRQLVSLPTGSGKTVVMGALAREVNKKTLLLAHREELIDQAVEKFKLVWPGVDIGVCMADRDEINAQVVIASVQSASRPKRLARLQDEGFEVMMIDEAHHSASESYQNVINTLGFSGNSNKLLLGVTATPQRSDKLGLGDTFTHVTFSRSISTMIRAGYLAPVIGRKILTNFSLNGIRSNNGEFSITELAEIVNTPQRNDFIVSKFKEYAGNRKAIAFCCDVKHCQDLSEAFNREGIKSSAVWGDMEGDQRKAVLENLKQGNIQVAISCGVLVEGFDEPSIACIVMARPTRSQGYYIQCVGRGLRIWPGKLDCLVLDFSDRHHNLDAVMTLSNTMPEAIHVKEISIERQEVDSQAKIEVLSECDQEFDVVGNTRFIWTDISEGEWSLQDDDNREIILSPAGEGYTATLHYQDGSSQTVVKEPIPFEYATGCCEDFARRHLKIAFCNLDASWMTTEQEPTKGQRDFLEKKESFCEGMTKREAALEIRKIIALKSKQRRALNNEPITEKQKWFLDNRGIKTANMTKWQAQQAIYRIKSEGVKYG